MYMHTNCLLFATCNKLLNNSTFYHLKSLIALPIGMIRICGGGGVLPLLTVYHSPTSMFLKNAANPIMKVSIFAQVNITNPTT